VVEQYRSGESTIPDRRAGASKPIIELGQGSSQRRSRRTLLFVFGACFGMWLFGVNDLDVSSLQLFVLTVVVLLTLVFVGVRRRRVIERARRGRVLPSSGRPPQTCVVIRHLGEIRDGASFRWG
jgi:hypothetical protein